MKQKCANIISKMRTSEKSEVEKDKQFMKDFIRITREMNSVVVENRIEKVHDSM